MIEHGLLKLKGRFELDIPWTFFSRVSVQIERQIENWAQK
jgi:hypothetical protein